MTNTASKDTLAAKEPKEYLNLLIMTIGPLVIGWFYYGFRAPALAAVCAATAASCDFAGSLIIKSRKSSYDFGALFTGIAIALMLPASFSFVQAAIGSAFAIIVCKLPFGSSNNSPFLPAAAGFAFLCLCWPDEVFNYPQIVARWDFLPKDTAFMPGVSLAAMLKHGNAPAMMPLTALNVFIGNVPGPMGTGSVLVLAAASFYYVFTRPAALLKSLGMLFTAAVFALIFPRIQAGAFPRVLFELCSGSLVFASLFLISDSSIQNQNSLALFLYGALAGLITMVLRHVGVFEEGVCFGVLLTSAFWPLFEKLFSTALKQTSKIVKKASSQQGGEANA